jgi:hypothetical protein
MRSLACLVLLAACGGSQPPVSEPRPGEEHATPPAAPDAASPPVPVAPDAGAPPPPPPAAGTRFQLKNESADTALNFTVTKGWGPVIFGYTGKPPKAKSVILFESACSASCDSPPESICPECPEPATKKEELAMARTESVAPGASFEVPWDGKVRVYEKAAGKRCKCWRSAEPAADSYTIKACGLRAPKIPGKPSRPECSETVVMLGPGQTAPAEIVLTFPPPKPPRPEKK